MAKFRNKNKRSTEKRSTSRKASQTPQEETVSVSPPPISKGLIPYGDFKMQSLILLVLGLVFYGNSFFNQYALDDGITIEKNEYVQAGFSGIADLMSRDAYDSYYQKSGGGSELSGGRYRPLSLVTFAIEQEFFGNNAFIRHLGNVVLYILSVILLLYFLRTYVFPQRQELAFLTALLFLIHPIHTEVVANVKSRDEIMSFLFIVLTFIYAFRYETLGKVKNLALGLLFFFLALLSKEYAVTLIALIPLASYLFLKRTVGQATLKILPFIGIAALYILIRLSALSPPAEMAGVQLAEKQKDVLNDPYQFADPEDVLPSKIFILGKYLQLQTFPVSLSADYSYNHYPFRSFGDPLVLLSVLLHLIMVIGGLWFLRRRHFLSFAIAFYFANLVLVGNVFFEIGATMGERLVYHSSFGFVMILAWALYEGFGRIQNLNTRKNAFYATMGVLIVLAGLKTITRNAEWKSDETLWLADVKTVPNSALANGNAGTQLIIMADREEVESEKKKLLNESLVYLQKALKIHPRYVNSLINIGLAHYRLEDYEEAERVWNKARTIFPTNTDLLECYKSLSSHYFNEGLQAGVEQDFEKSLELMERARLIDPTNGLIWANMGGALFTIKDYPAAEIYWQEALKLLPGNEDATKGLEALEYIRANGLDTLGTE